MNEKDNLEKNSNKSKGKRNDEKYIKEMHDMADKHAKRNNKVFIAVVIPVVVICIFVIQQIFSFSLNSTKKDSKPTTEFASETKTNDKNKTEDKKNSTDKEKSSKSALDEKIGKYLDKQENRQKSLDAAISINKGSNKGISVIYISEILRNNGIEIPKSTLSTKNLVKELEKQGFEKITDYKELQKGDIAFTTKDKSGNPSHAYIFLKWSKEGKTDYGTVCDGQINDYDSTIHKRNISVSTTTKDKISFFMRKK